MPQTGRKTPRTSVMSELWFWLWLLLFRRRAEATLAAQCAPLRRSAPAPRAFAPLKFVHVPKCGTLFELPLLKHACPTHAALVAAADYLGNAGWRLKRSCACALRWRA